jgi:hypothetical protein
MKVELLYFDGCPGYAELRARLARLLEQAEVDATIEERGIDSEGSVWRERFLGSPTLRIDGRDVDRTAAARHDYGLCCRLYQTEDGLHRTPPMPGLPTPCEVPAHHTSKAADASHCGELLGYCGRYGLAGRAREPLRAKLVRPRVQILSQMPLRCRQNACLRRGH